MSRVYDEDLDLLMRMKTINPGYNLTPALKNKIKKALGTIRPGIQRLEIEGANPVTRSSAKATTYGHQSTEIDTSSYPDLNELENLRFRIQTMENEIANSPRNLLDSSGSIMALVKFHFQLDSGSFKNFNSSYIFTIE